MKKKPVILADFQNADSIGRLRLNCAGTIQDLGAQGITLREGLQVELYDEELAADGVVSYSQEERIWVAAVDWKAIRQHQA
jgi:hypothetical protein